MGPETHAADIGEDALELAWGHRHTRGDVLDRELLGEARPACVAAALTREFAPKVGGKRGRDRRRWRSWVAGEEEA
jgi:hypothetical protein